MSVNPEWGCKIANGTKIMEVRKSIPKCDLPCKVYLYCTLPTRIYKDHYGHNTSDQFLYRNVEGKFTVGDCSDAYDCDLLQGGILNGKVFGEFILKSFCEFDPLGECTPQWEYLVGKILEFSGLTQYELFNYLNCKNGYGWFIRELNVYDKPKELSEFQKDLDCDDYPCNKGKYCEYDYYDVSEGCRACGIDFDGNHCIYKQLTRAPQSWCYVEHC